jgi:hypothetical protein
MSGTYDVGATRPEISVKCDVGSDKFVLMQQLNTKINDATFAFTYGLDTTPNKVVKSVERVPVEGDETLFTPRVHYADGTTLDVKKSNITEMKGNLLQYLSIPKGKSDDVFFNSEEEMPHLLRGFAKKTGDLYLNVELACPGAFISGLRRKSMVPATSAQQSVDTWGLQVFETKKINGEWNKGTTNVVSHVPLITADKQDKYFIGYVNFFPSYISLVAGGKSKLHFEGSVLFVAPYEGNLSDGMPTGEFQSSLPVVSKKLSKAKSQSPGSAAGASPKVADEGEYTAVDDE